MTEDRTPYVGANDQPSPTMFDRLRKVAQAETNKIILENWQGRPPDVEPLLRALLAEMRTVCDENGWNVIGSPMDFMATIDAILAEAGKSGA